MFSLTIMEKGGEVGVRLLPFEYELAMYLKLPL